MLWPNIRSLPEYFFNLAVFGGMCIKTGMNAEKKVKVCVTEPLHLADMLQTIAQPQRQTKETEQADSTFSEQV